MPSPRLWLLLLSVSLPLSSSAQSQHLVSDRKTIEISATERVVVAADIATIRIGYQNQSATKDAAYTENTRTANKIIQAILDAGVPKEAIETESLKLEEERELYEQKLAGPRKYSASQEWQIHSKASEAQNIVDTAVAAGANQIENVEWSVNDPDQLETKAYAAALKRAKNLAEQTAQTGLKLGDIVAIVNSTSSRSREFDRINLYAMIATPPKAAMLKLQPGTVRREASVTVTYTVVP
jgi:uncharacterized protein YggE